MLQVTTRFLAVSVSLSLLLLTGCGTGTQPGGREVSADSREVTLHVAGMTERLKLA